MNAVKTLYVRAQAYNIGRNYSPRWTFVPLIAFMSIFFFSFHEVVSKSWDDIMIAIVVWVRKVRKQSLTWNGNSESSFDWKASNRL